MERTEQRDHQRITAPATKMSPKISEDTEKDRKYRKGWKRTLLRKIEEFAKKYR
jgi:hypothetical protein